jgi:hypothetical protein
MAMLRSYLLVGGMNQWVCQRVLAIVAEARIGEDGVPGGFFALAIWRHTDRFIKLRKSCRIRRPRQEKYGRR